MENNSKFPKEFKNLVLDLVSEEFYNNYENFIEYTPK